MVAFALLDEHGESPFHLGEAVRVAEVGTRVAASADRPGRLRQAKLLGERAGTVCGCNSLAREAREEVPHGEIGVGGDERRTGRLLLE